MTKRSAVICWTGAGLVFVMSLIASVILYWDNTRLRSLLSKQEPWTLGPDMTRLLVSDLESSDLSRIDPWKFYFRHTIDRQADLQGRVSNIAELINLYRSKEHPSRSNYFGDVLVGISGKQQFASVTRKELLSYLGAPDEAVNVPGGEVLQYRFSWYGRASVALIRLTNDSVLQVGFNVLPSSSAELKR